MPENKPTPETTASNRNQPVRPPKRSLTPWVLLLPVALLVGGWLIINREPDEPETLPAVGNTAPSPTPQSKPTAAKPNPGGAPVKITVFVPDDTGNLQRRVVTASDIRNTELPTSPDRSYRLIATRAVETLLKQSPQNFPAGTRLISLKQADGSNVVEANFNDKFAQPDFWQGSTQTQMTVYSLVNTLAAVDNPEKQVRVRFLVEGKPVEFLGELDAKDPFEPDMALVAKG